MTQREHEHKVHGNLSPHTERGGYLLREPKGVPDVLLFSAISERDTLFAAANVLSVQGITARIAIFEDTERFHAQPIAYRETIFSDQPAVRIGIMGQESAGLLTEYPITLLPIGTSAAELVMAAVSQLHETTL